MKPQTHNRGWKASQQILGFSVRSKYKIVNNGTFHERVLIAEDNETKILYSANLKHSKKP